MSPIWQMIISIISIGTITTLFIQSLKYIFSPNYRLQINRRKHTNDATIYINYYQDVYEGNSINTKSSFELQKLTNAAFGTKNFSYELIFMLFDRDVREVELRAKDIQNRWLLITLDYTNKKIRCRLKKSWINRLVGFICFIYFIISFIIMGMALGYEWYGLRNYNDSEVFLSGWIIIFICAYYIYILGTLKSLDKIIDW